MLLLKGNEDHVVHINKECVSILQLIIQKIEGKFKSHFNGFWVAGVIFIVGIRV